MNVRWNLAVLLVFFCASAAMGQSLVDGRVIFGNAFKPVPQMTVHLVNKSRTPPMDQTQVTGPDGRYSFDDVPTGKGYAVAVYDNTGRLVGTDASFEVLPDARHTALPNIDIAKGVLADRAVRAGGLIQNDQGVVPGANITNQQLRVLPLYNRNFLVLGLIQPGVHDVQQGSPVQGAAFSIAGSPTTSTNFLLDGVDNVASSNNQAIPFQVNEAVQEFRVTYAAPDMRYGQGSGGVVDGLTRRCRGTPPTLATMEVLRRWGTRHSQGLITSAPVFTREGEKRYAGLRQVDRHNCSVLQIVGEVEQLFDHAISDEFGRD